MYDTILGYEFIAPNTYGGLLEVLNNKADFVKPPPYTRLYLRFIGDGIINAQGEQHKQHRRLLSPSFTTGNIRQQHKVIWSQATLFLQQLQRHFEKGSHSIDLNGWVGLVIRFLSILICDPTKYFSLGGSTWNS